jgi:AcrR family transcriptional regulator
MLAIMANVKRTTSSRKPSRAEKAQQTRLRMTRAAYELFVERGYPATTMTEVAEAAGVAVQTLYFTFGTKAQLLQRAYEYAVLGDGNDVPPEQQPWYAEMSNADRLDDALRILVQNVAAVLARTAPLDEYVRAASFDAEPARVRNFNENLRRQSWADMIDRLGTKFGLTPGLNPRRAADILMVLMSPATYQTFVGQYHWSSEDWQNWCTAAITCQLFAQ